MGSDRPFLLIFVLRIGSYKCAVRKKHNYMLNPCYPCELNSRVVRVANYCWTRGMGFIRWLGLINTDVPK